MEQLLATSTKSASLCAAVASPWPVPWARTAHRYAGLLGEFRQDMREEARILEASTIASSARLGPPANSAKPIRIAAASFCLTTTVLL
jgi:hypothetical protein